MTKRQRRASNDDDGEPAVSSPVRLSRRLPHGTAVSASQAQKRTPKERMRHSLLPLPPKPRQPVHKRPQFPLRSDLAVLEPERHPVWVQRHERDRLFPRRRATSEDDAEVDHSLEGIAQRCCPPPTVGEIQGSRIRNITERTLVDCFPVRDVPLCKQCLGEKLGARLERLFSEPSDRLLGGGWRRRWGECEEGGSGEPVCRVREV